MPKNTYMAMEEKRAKTHMRKIREAINAGTCVKRGKKDPMDKTAYSKAVRGVSHALFSLEQRVEVSGSTRERKKLAKLRRGVGRLKKQAADKGCSVKRFRNS